MKTPVRRLGASVAFLLASLAAGTSVAAEPSSPTGALAGMAATVAADAAGRKSGAAAAPAPASGSEADSRLLRHLSEGAVTAESTRPSPTDAGTADRGRDGARSPLSDTLRGCPRALLSALLAGAAETLVPETLGPETLVPKTLGPKTLGPKTLAPETLGPSTGDAVSALAIEREILGLCRERQEIVTGIVRAEGELRALLAESRGASVAPAVAADTASVADTPIVKVSTPVRVVSLTATPDGGRDEAPEKAAKPPAPSWSWFSIIGTAGSLRAGVSDGARGGTSVWFVREGDRLPGGLTVERIATRPPGVHVGGAAGTLGPLNALPYRQRPQDAIPAGAAR